MSDTTWPPESLKGLAPLDPLTAIGWRDCLSWAVSSDEIVAQFNADTGETYKPGRSPIEVLIDKASGADLAAARRFVAWFNKNIWGEDALEATA